MNAETVGKINTTENTVNNMTHEIKHKMSFVGLLKLQNLSNVKLLKIMGQLKLTPSSSSHGCLFLW